MSVSSFDTSAHASPMHDHAHTPSHSGAPASRHAPAAQPTLGGYGGHGNVSYHSHGAQPGPMFGNPQLPIDAHHHAAQHFNGQNQGAAPPAFFQQLSQMLSQWFGGLRPQRPDTSIGNPYPAAPRNSDPRYSSQSNEGLLGLLRDNFSAFQDPRTPGFASGAQIYSMASQPWSLDRNTNENIRLANELLRRPELMKSLDRNDASGALDGMFSLNNLFSVLYASNPFKFTSDKDLAGEILSHFAELRGAGYGDALSFSEIGRMAARSWSGDSSQNFLTQLAQEVVQRREVLSAMDNALGRPNDGFISRAGLLYLIS